MKKCNLGLGRAGLTGPFLRGRDGRPGMGNLLVKDLFERLHTGGGCAASAADKVKDKLGFKRVENMKQVSIEETEKRRKIEWGKQDPIETIGCSDVLRNFLERSPYAHIDQTDTEVEKHLQILQRFNKRKELTEETPKVSEASSPRNEEEAGGSPKTVVGEEATKPLALARSQSSASPLNPKVAAPTSTASAPATNKPRAESYSTMAFSAPLPIPESPRPQIPKPFTRLQKSKLGRQQTMLQYLSMSEARSRKERTKRILGRVPQDYNPHLDEAKKASLPKKTVESDKVRSYFLTKKSQGTVANNLKTSLIENRKNSSPTTASEKTEDLKPQVYPKTTLLLKKSSLPIEVCKNVKKRSSSSFAQRKNWVPLNNNAKYPPESYSARLVSSGPPFGPSSRPPSGPPSGPSSRPPSRPPSGPTSGPSSGPLDRLAKTLTKVKDKTGDRKTPVNPISPMQQRPKIVSRDPNGIIQKLTDYLKKPFQR